MDLKKSLSKNRNMTALIALFVVAVAVIGWFFPRGINLIFISLAITAFLIALGLSTHGLKRGILISDVNLISLSRFQLIIWTVIILSAFFTFAIERVHAFWDICGYFPSVVTNPAFQANLTYACNCTSIQNGLFVRRIANPLDVTIDWTLWALMGISSASFVGSSLIASGKDNKDPAVSQIQKTAQVFSQDKEAIEKNSRGIRYGNPDPKDSRFMDMFEGDEIGNTAYIDMSKVQMFFFTVIAALAYYIMALQMTIGTPPSEIDKLPLIPQGLLWIFGISHAGYLGNKSVDHTPQDSEGGDTVQSLNQQPGQKPNQ